MLLSLVAVLLASTTQQQVVAQQVSSKNKLQITSAKIAQVNRECLDEQNRARALHRVPALRLNNELISMAGLRAASFAATNKWTRDDFVYARERVGQSWALFNYNSDITG